MDITSKRIRERRISMNLSQFELAEMCGYRSRSSIAKIETSAKNVPLDKIELFAKALRTNPDYLMGWNDDPDAPFTDIDFRNSALSFKQEPKTERERVINSLSAEIMLMNELKLETMLKFARLINKGDL